MAALTVRAAAFAALPLLAACSVLDEQSAAVQRADTAAFAQTELAGMSKAEILACAGKPARTVKAGDTESLVYVSGPAGNTCDVTFVIRRGYVEKVDYSVSNVGVFSQGNQCAYVVQKCTRPR